MMERSELLERLSALAGILPEYVDNWGERHAAPAATRRALLTAMGIDVSTTEKIRAAIAEFESRPWRKALEPVSVVRAASVSVRVVTSDSTAAEEWSWRLVLEQGREHGGKFRPADLVLLDSRSIDGKSYTARKLDLTVAAEPGYHRLELYRAGKLLAAQTCIIAPDSCYQPSAVSGDGRIWGPAAQLYALRSERNWGMGDFTDLRILLEQWALQGADIIGLNPLHALFPHNPEHASPYSPSSRLFLNALYLDVENIDDFHECEAARAMVRSPEFQMRLEAQRASELVDYAGVAALKLPVLELLYRNFREHHLIPGSERAGAFRAFQEREGERLYRHALFEALQEHFHHHDPNIWGWPVWPLAYRNPLSKAVQEFEAQHRERIEYFVYLQWQADNQLAAVGLRSLELGLGVGLYLDLAVSVDGGGAEAWANQGLYALGVGVGAPPEFNNQLGQDWGLPPFVPDRLREAAYAPFIATLRHNMRHSGALRLDHVMGLMRQFWVPAGMPPTEGAYVSYSFDDMLGILALESQRNKCLVIGEDLGTVPAEVQSALLPLGVLSYRLLILEKNAEGDFIPPQQYPAQALAAVTTHDLPTLTGYWEGRDILRRTELELFSSEEARSAKIVERAQERAYLLLALEREGLLPEGITVNPVSLPTVTPEIAQAVHGYLARSPARVLMVQLEDMLGVQDQINIPATTTQHPNWRRKLPVNLEAYPADRRIIELAAVLRQERPRQRALPLPERSLKIPLSTYRIQLNSKFTFADAARLVPYLAQLGVSHVYCSPYLKARAGSSHGYDIVDHNSLNPEIGSTEDYEAFCNALHAHDMGQIVDLVPNHMGVMGADNHWWLDVLENGPASIYAPFFDIDWHPLKEELRGKVLLPILGYSYGDALEAGELKLTFDENAGSFSVWYYNHRMPIAPREYARLLRHRLSILETQLGPDNPELLELASLITAFENLPPRDVTEPEKILERNRDRELLKRRLAALVAVSAPVRQMVQDLLMEYNGRAGEPETFVLLHELMEAQPWRIANWRVASDEINYRRFFDINDLAALRMEDNHVFEATHQFILELIAAGKVDGLRIDHPDGLYDPQQYFQRLQDRVSLHTAPAEGGKAVYVLAEKILANHESLREDWAIHGTTGYDFCNLVNGIFVDPHGRVSLERTYRLFSNERMDFEKLVYRSKHQIMKHAMASELNVLAGHLSRISELRPHTRDFTTNNLRNALAEVIACLPVYRTYFRGGEISQLDRRYVEWAVARAKKLSQVQDITIFDFIGSVLLIEMGDEDDRDYLEAVTGFAMKFQQLSSPVMAKGCEDTAFYLYNRLVSLNEVGGEPRRLGVSIKAFHAENAKRRERWPHAMLTTSTHDNKRSEDVRARINVISEIPTIWHDCVQRWCRFNKSKKRIVDRIETPSTNDEYLFYQTLIGIWPFGALDAESHESLISRVEAYMLKAVREAKLYTSWINQNTAYEEGLAAFVRELLKPSETNAFLADFLPFQQRVARLGIFNSLSQTLLKLTAPGVPDIYQGNEIWDFSLVDPDNRRRVDYIRRQQYLSRMEADMGPQSAALSAHLSDLLKHMEDGRAKLYLIWHVLRARRQWSQLFQHGDYTPLEVSGKHADHVCAFARSSEQSTLIVVAPRWYAQLAPEPGDLPLGDEVWHDTAIDVPVLTAGAVGSNVLTGESITLTDIESRLCLPVATLLASFPVALVKF